MRVFVTGTGRCGSVSFAHACTFISNYSVAHESPCGLLHYPDNHIEVNPQLRYVIKPLAEQFPDAKWVHLVRDRDACADSLAALNGGKWMQHFNDLCPTVMPNSNPTLRAKRVYEHLATCIDVMIERFVKPENRRRIDLDHIGDQWPQFLQWIGAEGDLQASINSWSTPRNTREDRCEQREVKQ